MTMLDMSTTRVRTLEDWSPHVDRAHIDMAALLADMRRSGVAALDEFAGECLDGERVPFIVDYLRAWQIAGALPETDRLLLLGRAAQTAALVTYIHLTWPETIETGKARCWAGLVENAVASIADTKPPLDDRTAAALARAARISALMPLEKAGRVHPLYVADILAGCTPEPMSDAQRQALADVADLIDGLAWDPHRYADAIRAVEPLYQRLGRAFSDSVLFQRRERATETARLAVAYVCEGASPPIKAWLEALCQRSPDSKTEELRNSFPAEVLALTASAKADALGMMAEANRRKEALEAKQIADFPSFAEYSNYASIGSVTYYGSGPFGNLLRQLLKAKLVAGDAAAAALLTAMPVVKILEDLRIVNTAIATMKAEAAPQTIAAAGAYLAWLEKKDWSWASAKEKSYGVQAVHRLKTALADTGAAASGKPAAEEPLPPRPVLNGWANSVAFEKALTAYYGELTELRKCTRQDIAFVENYLRGPERPATPYKVTEETTQEQFDEQWAIRHWATYSRLFRPALLDRMRKAAEVPAEFHAAWKELHLHTYELEGKSAPSEKWLKAARQSMASLSADQRVAFLTTVLDLLTPELGSPTDLLARAIIYLSADWAADVVGPILTRHAQQHCFDTIPSWGMRNERLGNACLWALIHLPDGGGVRYLARLLSRVKYPKVKKRIEAALNEATAAAGISRGELDELSIPTHDLDARGTAEIAVGDGAALLSIAGTASVEVTWRAANGKVSRSVPAALKEHKDAIKSVKALAKEIEADLSVQPQRLQRSWLEDRRWTAETWRQRYAEHPLVGALSRRLIWNVHHADDRVAGVWTGNGMTDVRGKPVSIDGADITLWHPIGCTVEEVMAWRARLDAMEITQPFKQAHREVYLLTDAERRTSAYSNRFAGHIVKQHQFMALARLNGWMVTHRIWADRPNDEPTHIVLPRHGLIAELWTEGAGGDDPEVNDAQAYLYLTTDRVGFYRIADPAEKVTAAARGPRRGEAVSIADVPPLVLSEVMRHCDLFVGVASVANDPNWTDGGEAAEHPNQWRRTVGANYWRSQAFGDLGMMAETRLALLRALLPRLAIGKVSRIIDDKYLRVEGKLRAYKIHLGSGNILIEPTDQYLCIVPASAGEVKVRLPFEGDNMLSIILSKAAMLAADDEITDRSILSQFQR
ncbi:DUF4132 domain-containing protein [Bradyrhizobium tropiciagri]|uniref:DUF4132 domain-containing protein n=1 Tax=Bradyrhizobium tropiciagri TaxID=312253 RepID=UPI001BA788F7|nr:DUF4132 domain-containing protein [Bradyrhizobium tropiciagri]MBR0869794.1 DUF4132 domain-containing protein [Bradyrhizobium tropiciagri]